MRNPIAESSDTDGLRPLTARVDSLAGKRIGFYNNAKPAAEPVTTVLGDRLAASHRDVSVVRFHVPARSEDQLRQIGEWAAAETDVCITVIGDCGGCTRAVVRATNTIEAHGIPAVGLVAENFGLSFETHARDQGRLLRYQSVPVRSETTDMTEIRAAVGPAVLAGIEAALTEPLSGEELGEPTD